MIRLQKFGAEHILQATARPLHKAAAAIQAAFDLGFSAGQYATEKHSEEYFWAGLEACEWRKEGQPKAGAERRRQGNRTRDGVNCVRRVPAAPASSPDTKPAHSQQAQSTTCLTRRLQKRKRSVSFSTASTQSDQSGRPVN
jgi:hypothetical protein